MFSIGLVFWVCPLVTLAQGTSTSSLPRLSETKNTPSEFSLRIFYAAYDTQSRESSKSGNDKSLDSTTQFESQYLFHTKDNSTAKKIHFILGYYPAVASSYIAAPEIYYSKKNSLDFKNVEFDYTIGRRQTLKNTLDDTFNLGLINPYFTQDHINYTAQGLTGFHSQIGNENFVVGANFYPLFIPNQGPANIIKNGTLIGVNRWAQSAPQTFVYNDKENKIDYSIHDYNLYDLMTHSGYSLLLQGGDLEKTNQEFNVTYSDSPMNDIIISRTIVADLNLNGSVEIFPVVRYSRKLNSDFKYRINNTTFFISYLMDTPENQLENDDHAVQVLAPIYGYGTGLQVDLTDFVNRHFQVSVAYGKFYGGEIQDTDSGGEPNTFSLSNNRLLYQNPFKISTELEGFRLISKPVFFNASWIYDGNQNGSLLSLQVRHEPLQNMNVSLGVDVIGVVDDTETAGNKKTFLSRHSADDRLTGAIQYVF